MFIVEYNALYGSDYCPGGGQGAGSTQGARLVAAGAGGPGGDLHADGLEPGDRQARTRDSHALEDRRRLERGPRRTAGLEFADSRSADRRAGGAAIPGGPEPKVS